MLFPSLIVPVSLGLRWKVDLLPLLGKIIPDLVTTSVQMHSPVNQPRCFNPRSRYTLSIADLVYQDDAQDTIDTIHEKGAAAVCYISVGTIEDWRSDATDFPEAAIGNDVDGWPGEKWIDVKNNVRRWYSGREL